MLDANDPVRNQRGVALVIAVLGLLVLSSLATVFMVVINTEKKMTGHATREGQALGLAEAGVAEALARIRAEDVPDNGNPRMVSQIFLAAPGSVPALGADSVALATQQPAADWLTYSTSSRGPQALTVQYKTDSARTVIYKYDTGADPAVQTASGMPIFQIVSTGRVGNDSRTVFTEVIRKPITPSVKGAVTANVETEFEGSAVVNGMNHSADTPAGSGATGADPANYVGSGDLPAAWSTDEVEFEGAAQGFGSPVISQQYQTGFFAGPWNALNMTQAEFYSWIGPPTSSAPSVPTGLVYLDNNTTPQDRSGAWSYQGGDGNGFLYVDGDLTLNGNFTFRGLIYVEGDLKINGTAWILGGIVVRGRTEFEVESGNATILYSRDAISRNIARAGEQFVTVSWREIR
ncbi:MAG: hypothetical protein HZC42_15535 [Candidatus Eisenbacteria bacterium]|nr:hypothetical protein [Candidatus Eisenbacteria bacterium]